LRILLEQEAYATATIEVGGVTEQRDSWSGLSPRQGVVLFAAIVGALLVALTVYNVRREYDLEVERVRQQTQRLTLMLEEHARQSLRRINATLARTTDLVQRAGDLQRVDWGRLRDQLRARLPADGLIRAFIVIDRHGQTMLTTRPEVFVELAEVDHRDYFRAHRDNADNGDTGMVIGATVKSSFDGRWMMPFSARFDDALGRFDGVVAAIVDPGYFQSFYDSIDVGPNGFVTLILRSGWIAVRAPFNEEMLGRQWLEWPLFREHLPKSNTGTVQQVALSDGIERIHSYRALSDYPVITALGLSLDDSLAGWRARVWRAAALIALGVGTLIAATALLVRQLAWREAAEARFRSLTQLSSDWYWEQDAAYRFTLMEGNVNRMHGIAPSWFIGKRREDVGFGNITLDEWAAHRGTLERHEPFRDFIGIRYASDGSIINATATSGEPVFDRKGRFVGYRGVGRDVTPQVRLEHALRARERELQAMADSLERRVAERTAEVQAAYRELEGISYSVSHDLRQPLRAIDGFASILKDESKLMLPAEAARQLDRIGINARRMAQLIDGLLTFMRVSRHALKVERVEPERIVGEVLHRRAADLEKTGTTVSVRTLPACHADAVLLREVFEQLLANAIKFSACAASPRIEVFAEADQGQTIYAVRDNGVGFDTKFADKLFGVFERLHTDHYEGEGIGLAFVHRIVERHNGRVWAVSSPGQGATFYFTLAAAVDEPLASIGAIKLPPQTHTMG
jgi:signal transduction histidine kinase